MSDEPILGFNNQYKAFSNFNPSPFVGTSKLMGEQHYRWNEQWYMVHKTHDPWHRARIMCATTASDCKKFGREAPLRDDWEQIKDIVMLTGLRLKFGQNAGHAAVLDGSGKAYIEETNHWRDEYWGVNIDTGVGKNMLSILLMQVRAERVKLVTP